MVNTRWAVQKRLNTRPTHFSAMSTRHIKGIPTFGDHLYTKSRSLCLDVYALQRSCDALYTV